MARPIEDEEEKPLDPAVESVRRKLVRFMMVNLGLLFVALMVVVAALVYKSRDATPPALAERPAGAVVEGSIPLPAGARIVSQSLSGDRLSVEVELADGKRAILLYDLAAARIVGRYALTAE